VPEPVGGAHRDPEATAQALKKALAEVLKQLQEKKPRELVEERLERLMAYGKFKEAAER
jgi:acetyl-CoA carboxylase carboxyl transferase subunit alpha